jgi:hypothetical protein
MAEPEGADVGRKLALTVSTILLIAGIALYWAWGLMYDTWYPFTKGNIGIFSIYAPLMAFGLIGIMLYWKKPTSAGR